MAASLDLIETSPPECEDDLNRFFDHQQGHSTYASDYARRASKPESSKWKLVEAPTESSEVTKAFANGFNFGAIFSFLLGIVLTVLLVASLFYRGTFYAPEFENILGWSLFLSTIICGILVPLIAVAAGGGLVSAVMSAIAAALSDRSDLEEESEHPLD